MKLVKWQKVTVDVNIAWNYLISSKRPGGAPIVSCGFLNVRKSVRKVAV